MANDNPQHHAPFTEAQFWSVIGATARNVAAVIIAFGVIWGGGWYVLEPRINEYFKAQMADFVSRLEGFESKLGDINKTLSEMQTRLPAPRPFLEVSGGGRLDQGRVYAPGDTLTFLYLLRRNNDCPTQVLVQFWSASTNGVASEYSTTVPAQQATPSFGFQLFPVRVRLPLTLPAGAYSYAPVLKPDRAFCPGERDVIVQPSDFFTVSRNE